MNRHQSRILRNIISGILTVITLILAFFTIVNLSFNFLYVKTNVKGYSMLPTINTNVESAEKNGDAIYINKYTKVNVNDIVVAKPKWYTDYIIKRLVGKPGDIIEIKDEDETFGLYVNNKLLYSKDKHSEIQDKNLGSTIDYFKKYEEFLSNDEFSQFVTTKSDGTKVIALEDNEYFLMGDNWGKTLDCLSKGPLTKQELVGKVELVIDVTENNIWESTKHFLCKMFSKQ